MDGNAAVGAGLGPRPRAGAVIDTRGACVATIPAIASRITSPYNHGDGRLQGCTFAWRTFTVC